MQVVHRLLLLVTGAVFGILAIISIVYMITKTLDTSGSIDFHSYWYAGHFIRQGRDPYTGFVNGDVPDPLDYLDAASTGIVRQGKLATVPANTAPLVWLLTIFSFFSWQRAKMLWLMVNLVNIAITPWLIWRLLPDKGHRLGILGKLLFVLIFGALFGTRNVVGNGQTSMLIFVLMLTSVILSEHSWLTAGLAMGVALSKYSLALPILLLFLWERRWNVVLTGLLVQVVGVLALAIHTNTSIWEIILAQFEIFLLHMNLDGIHLGALFQDGSIWRWYIPIVITFIVFDIVVHQRMFHRVSASSRFTLLTILMLWTLLVAYHRAYDTFTAILFVTLTGWGLSVGEWKLNRAEQVVLWFLLVLSIGVLCLPSRGMAIFISWLHMGTIAAWIDLYRMVMTGMLSVMLATSLWLCRHLVDS